MRVAARIRRPVEGAAHGLWSSSRVILGAVVACGVLAAPVSALESSESSTPSLASTGAATEVTPTSATLTGTVQSIGTQTIYGVQTGAQAGDYGPDIIVGQQSGTSTETIALHLSELQPGTTYHYRVYATNQTGVSYGADAVFTTPAFPDPLTQLSAPPPLATPQIKFPSEVPTVTTVKAKSKPHKKGKSKKPPKRRHGELHPRRAHRTGR